MPNPDGSRRIDHLDNPNAPAANSMAPSVNAIVVNDAGEILLIRRTDNDNWAVPGGAIDFGESIEEATVREVKEESGIEVEVTGIVGIYTNPKHVIEYTSNGEVRQEFSVVFTARPLHGQPTPSSETSEARWVDADTLVDYPMHPSMKTRIDHYLQRASTPFIC